MKPVLVHIEDKTEIAKDKFCPAHWIPHKLPLLTERIIDEPCHYHNKLWRMLHHKAYCKILRCPHYEFMINTYKKNKK